MQGKFIASGSGGQQGTTTTPTADAPSGSSASHRGRRLLRRGPFPGARARARGGVLNPELVSKSAAELVEFLECHHTSTYVFKEVGLVLRERERRLGEAEDVASSLREDTRVHEMSLRAAEERVKEVEDVGRNLRDDIRARDMSLSAAEARILEAEAVASTLRDQVRARDLSLDAAEARVLEAEAAAACLGMEMSARELLLWPPDAVAEAQEWQRRADEAQARVRQLEELESGLRSEIRARDLSLCAADVVVAEASHRAADAEARRQAEARVWQRRADESEARRQAEVRELQRRSKRLCDAIGHFNSVVEGPRSSTARRAATPPPPTPVQPTMDHPAGTAK
jgi:chromosome segregation ATPase